MSLASFSPNPVSSFTSLTTANLEPPAAVRITSNSDCSSLSTSSPPATGPATATAAAGSSHCEGRTGTQSRHSEVAAMQRDCPE